MCRGLHKFVDVNKLNKAQPIWLFDLHEHCFNRYDAENQLPTVPSFVPAVQNEPLSRCYQGRFDRDQGRDALHPLALLAFKKCMIT